MKPMLAAVAELDKIKFPVYASPKLDGVRCVLVGGKVLSRSLKPIPNAYVQACLRGIPLDLDGELIVGKPNAKDAYNKTTSAVMSEDGEPAFKFYVFDFFHPGSYRDRRLALSWSPAFTDRACVKLLPQRVIKNEAALLAYEAQCLAKGYEGIMIRSPDGPYKQGRSTVKEGYLLKLKKSSDDEAEVLGVVEQMHNANEAKKNALGRTERSSHKANKVPMDTLGALICKDLKTGVLFNIGSGFTEATRKELWRIKTKLIGRIVKYKHQGAGAKIAPRFPVFLGFRDRRDM